MIEDRHGKSSTIIASQLPVANWYDVIGEETQMPFWTDMVLRTELNYKVKV